MCTDKELINRLGGSTSLAKKIGYSVQRVQNWKKRGIPASVKLKYPSLFLCSMSKNEKTASSH